MSLKRLVMKSGVNELVTPGNNLNNNSKEQNPSPESTITELVKKLSIFSKLELLFPCPENLKTGLHPK
jgi:hypothetical protein